MRGSITKRLLFGLLWPGHGGHTHTALTLAVALRQRGYAIEVLVDEAAGSAREVADAGFPIERCRFLEGDFLQRAFRRHLADLIRSRGYRAVHWFEKVHGVYEAAAAVAASRDAAFVWTVTSGGPPPRYHGLNRAVVFTRAVAADAVRRSPATCAHVLPARIDTARFGPAFVDAARADVRTRLGLAGTDLLVVRVARCAPVYVRSVEFGIALTVRLRQRGHPAVFLHAGYVEDPRVAAAIRRMVDTANQRAGRVMAWSEVEDVGHAARYLAAADLCLASGRTAIEALALARPTLVVWGDYYLGLVGRNNVGSLADTNFQAWSRPARPGGSPGAVDAMLADVEARVRNIQAGEREQQACRAFIDEHYSLERAVDQYEALYADRAITLDSALRHYAHPGTLAGEIRRRLLRGRRHSRSVRLLRRWLT